MVWKLCVWKCHRGKARKVQVRYTGPSDINQIVDSEVRVYPPVHRPHLRSPFCDLAHLEPASQADNSPCQSSHPTLANEQIVAIGNRMAKMKPVPILNQLANVLVRIDQLSAY